MIKSCSECKVKCCKTGPGPYEVLPPEEYLENFGTTDAYNTKCQELKPNGMCGIWGTPDFPLECRTYVCQTRKYSKEELDHIDAFQEDLECETCGSALIYAKEVKDSVDDDHTVGRTWTLICETCGQTDEWQLTKASKGHKR